MSVFAVFLMAILHRLRGGGFITLPVKGTYVLWPLVGLIAFLLGYSIIACVAWAIGYLVWIVPGWMSVITRALGVPVPTDQVMGHGWDVHIVDLLSFDRPILGCFIRAGLFLIPLAVALVMLDLNPLGLLLIVCAFYPSYRLGAVLRPTDMSSIAEILVGASVGGAMVLCRFT